MTLGCVNIGLVVSLVVHAAGAARSVFQNHHLEPNEGDLPPIAQQRVTTLVDDLDDTVPAEETVTFALDGTSYEIDLSAEHAAGMRDDLRTWVTHARRTSRGGRARRSPTPAGGRVTSVPRGGGARSPTGAGGRGPRLGPQQRAHRLDRSHTGRGQLARGRHITRTRYSPCCSAPWAVTSATPTRRGDW